MSVWVKICGNTSLADAQLAADAGADAVGFVFATSPRQVTVEQVAAITPHLPASVEKIGVFVDADFSAIALAVERCGLTGVQMHGGGTADLAIQLRNRFGSVLRIVQVLHFGEDVAARAIEAQTDPNIDAILIDSRTPTAIGGTGVAFNWYTASEEIFASSSGKRLIAAGGLNPGNVAQAIGILKPWGVDVATGAEAAPGMKDAAKVQTFVANARLAANLCPKAISPSEASIKSVK